jgi:ABC-type phosphate transport system substrate-binding protein
MRTTTVILRACALAVGLVAIVIRGVAPQAQQGTGFQVIVNSANPVSALTRDDVARLFLKERTSWDGGLAVEAVDQRARSDVREAFSTAALGRSPRAVIVHWQRQIFSGRDVPPRELESDDAVVEYVRTHAGAVGYVSPGGAVYGVKTVEIRR